MVDEFEVGSLVDHWAKVMTDSCDAISFRPNEARELLLESRRIEISKRRETV